MLRECLVKGSLHHLVLLEGRPESLSHPCDLWLRPSSRLKPADCLFDQLFDRWRWCMQLRSPSLTARPLYRRILNQWLLTLLEFHPWIHSQFYSAARQLVKACQISVWAITWDVCHSLTLHSQHPEPILLPCLLFLVTLALNSDQAAAIDRLWQDSLDCLIGFLDWIDSIMLITVLYLTPLASRLTPSWPTTALREGSGGIASFFGEL